MKERPILFSGSMVRAILEGRKTQTRRVVTPQPPAGQFQMATCISTTGNKKNEGRHHWVLMDGVTILDSGDEYFVSHYGYAGDRLWVRETFAEVGDTRHLSGYVRYKADEHLAIGAYGCQKWKPSIFMPRWACRILLDVVSVRVERLQDISNEDAIAEGIDCVWRGDNGPYEVDQVPHYRTLWDSINGKKYSWSSNPWVWVITFKRSA